jgi:hypothetical protein
MTGCTPIRAKKARYYVDRELQSRILPSPKPSNSDDAVRTPGSTAGQFGLKANARNSPDPLPENAAPPQAAVVEAAVASHLSPDGADRLEAACPRPRRLPHCIPRSSARPAVAARGEKERHRARDMGLDLGAQRIELFSEQRSHDQGHKDQVLKKSGRRREALRGKG